MPYMVDWIGAPGVVFTVSLCCALAPRDVRAASSITAKDLGFVIIFELICSSV
jgi:hypothetical protein